MSTENKEHEGKWDARYMALAAHIASWSKHHGRKVGAVIVGPDHEIRSTGFNGFPRGVDADKDERYVKPIKYYWSLCSERNAICNAARMGAELKDCVIYVSSMFPCAECAKEIIQSGIKRLVCHEPDLSDETYSTSFRISHEMLTEAEVEIVYFPRESAFADGYGKPNDA